jgi:hypothetical protein
MPPTTHPTPRRKAPRTSESTLPMGVDLRDAVAHFCLGRRVGLDIEVIRAGSIPLPERDTTSPDRAQERRTAFEDGLSAYGVSERRAIISMREEDALDIPHPDPSRVPQSEWAASALVYAKERRAVVPDDDELVARMIVENDRATIFAVLESHIRSVEAEAVSMGLRPVVIDAPQAAWLRVAPDGIITMYQDRDGYIVTPVDKTVHGQHIIPEPHIEAQTIAQTLSTFRSNYNYRGHRIASMLPLGHPLYAKPNETRIEPLTIAGRTTPAWAFAMGLFLVNESMVA